MAEVSSGRSDLLIPHEEAGQSRIAGTGNRFNAGAAAFAAAASKPWSATVMTLDRIGRLHRRHGVAGIDRALEGIGMT